MESEEAAGTRVELHDTRDVIGRGSSLRTVRFPRFHMFDAMWKLKLRVTDENEVSLQLQHGRRDDDDLWEMEALVGFRIEEPAIQADAMFLFRFSQLRNKTEFWNVGVWMIPEGIPCESSDVCMTVSVFMQVKRSLGIQLRSFIDFSRRLPIFSDAVICVGDVEFHVNRMVLSMASPVLFRAFLLGEHQITLSEVADPRDFRRILNFIYPPHLPPKQWIKEHDPNKQLAHIYRILEIAKVLECAKVLEIADEWLLKNGRFELGAKLLLAQNFGLRRLMGSEIAGVQSIKELSGCVELEFLSNRTKALILDHFFSIC